MKGEVEAAVVRLLGPLIALLLEAGIGVGDLVSLVKVAYVRGAEHWGREASGEVRPNISRIAVVTGLTRTEVATILATGEGKSRQSARQGQRAERVLSGWWADPEFQTELGEPAVLNMHGSKRSFAALCRRYSGGRRSAPILDELLRVRAVRQLADGRVQAVSRTYATVRWDREGIAALGEHLTEHCATLVKNLKEPARPRLDRHIVNHRLDPRFAPMLIRDIEGLLRVHADSIDDTLNDRQYVAKPGTPAMGLGVGIYVFETPASPDDSARPPERAEAKSPRKRGHRQRG